MRFKHRPFDAHKDGHLLATAIASKLGTHEGSEGHPINFERSGEYHRYLARYVFDEYRVKFAEGYRDGWREACMIQPPNGD